MSAAASSAEQPAASSEDLVPKDLPRSRKMMEPYVKNASKCCGIACGVQCCFVLIFIIAMCAGGTNFIAMSSGVALHLWPETYKVRGDSVLEGERRCTLDPRNRSQRQQEEEELPDGGKYEITLVYVAKNGNAFTGAHLNKIKELESHIASRSDYGDYCLREEGQSYCKPAESVGTPCRPLNRTASSLLQQDVRTPSEQPSRKRTGQMMAIEVEDSGLLRAMKSSGEKLNTTSGQDPGCTDVRSTPVGLYRCTSQQWPCPYADRQLLDEASMNSKLQAYANSIFGTDHPQTSFLMMTDTTFTTGSSSSKAVKSEFKFGFPLATYTETTDRPKDQKQRVEDFFEKIYKDKLKNFNSDQGKDPDLKLGYAGGNLMDLAIADTLNGDFAMVLLAFVVVWLYVAFMLKSWWYATLGMTQIFACFLCGTLLYRLLFGNSFFGTFHIIAIFLLVGIGIDDVFVFNGNYDTALAMEEYKDDLWGRIAWTWRQSVGAMGVTSSSTAVSFFLNGSSKFAGISSFGIFAGSLIVCLYTSMCFYWPAVVVFNEHYFAKKKFCGGLGEKLCCCGRKKTEGEEQLSGEKDPGAHADDDKPALTQFFEHQFSAFILKQKVLILIIFAGISGFMWYQCSRLEVEKEEGAMLPGSHSVQVYIDEMKNSFVRGGGLFNTEIKLIFGMQPGSPVNRDGTDHMGENWGEGPATVGAAGSMNWNSQFSSGVPRAFDCWIHLCNAMEAPDTSRNTGGPPAYTAQGCWPRDVKSEASDTEWNRITNSNESFNNPTLNAVVERITAQNATWFDTDVKPYSFGQNVSGTNTWRFSKVLLKLTSNTDIGPDDGKQLYDRWEDWLKSQMSSSACSAAGPILDPFIASDHFTTFVQTDTLMGEMLQGVMISIGVAFAVLILATGNLITGSMAALTIGCIVSWVMATVPLRGQYLGMTENICLIMVPGLAVDFTAHLAEAYNGCKHDDRAHRVTHALEHSGASIISGAISTCLASGCLLFCQITFFNKFGTMILFTMLFAVLFSLFFFPALLAVMGPTGQQGDWTRWICKKKEEEKEEEYNNEKKEKKGKEGEEGEEG